MRIESTGSASVLTVQRRQAAASSTAAAAAAASGAASAPTGTTTGPLSSTTVWDLLGTAPPADATQGGTAQSAASASGGALPVGEQHWLQDIATDPAYAAQQASNLAGSTAVVYMSPSEVPKNGDPPSAWEAFGAALDGKLQLATQAQQQSQDLYHNESAQGVPPAQIYADMLKQQMSQSDAVLATQGPSAQEVRDTLQARLTYLQQAMATAGSGGGSSTLATA